MSLVIEIKNISKKIWKNEILKWVNFWVQSWEIYGFLWPNWAWKTTLMKSIMWLIKIDSWEIDILKKGKLNVEIKKQIWFMPENTYLYKYLTWREFLKFNWKFYWLKWAELDKKVEYLLEKVWLENAWNKYLKSYSKWMLQRIWLAQSIINNPKILFLDEPMSGLDPLWRKMVKDLILEMKSKWSTVFFNTHVLADVESICDRFSIINKGEIIIEWMKTSDLTCHLEEFFIEKVTNHNSK